MVEYCPIYIQDGKLLHITTSLGFWTEKDNKYYSVIFGRTINYTTTWESENGNDHVAELRDASIDVSLKTSYINPETNSSQGVGSGAGYIELDNGSYTISADYN